MSGAPACSGLGRRGAPTLLAILLLAACTPPESPAPPVPVEGPAEPAAAAEPAPAPAVAPRRPPLGAGNTAYRCPGDLGFVLRLADDGAELHLPGRTIALVSTPTGAGARYTGERADLRTSGAEALLEVDGTTLSGCRSDVEPAPWAAARARGSLFRALGQEPGWHLEVTRSREMRFVGDYGETTRTLQGAAFEPLGGGEGVWAAGEGDGRIEVRADERPCFDVMSGEPYELTVTVRERERVHAGCGRFLQG